MVLRLNCGPVFIYFLGITHKCPPAPRIADIQRSPSPLPPQETFPPSWQRVTTGGAATLAPGLQCILCLALSVTWAGHQFPRSQGCHLISKPGFDWFLLHFPRNP